MYRYATIAREHPGRVVGSVVTTDPGGVGPSGEPATFTDPLRFDALLAAGVAVEAGAATPTETEPTEPPKRRSWQPKE